MLPPFQYLQADSLEHARVLLGRYAPQIKLLAGGTELLVAMRQGLERPTYLLSLKGVGLQEIKLGTHGQTLEIGSMVKLHTLLSDPLIKQHCPLLVHSAQQTATATIRNQATVGGNLCQNTRCWYYNQSAFARRAYGRCFKTGGAQCHQRHPHCQARLSADLAPALLALQAQVRLAGPQQIRLLPLAAFYQGSGVKPNCLHPDEIMTTIIIPLPTPPQQFFTKVTTTPSMDFSLLTWSVALQRDQQARINQVCLVLGSVSPAPWRLQTLEHLLTGRKLDITLLAQVLDQLEQQVQKRKLAAYTRQRTVTALKQLLYAAMETE